MGNVATSLIAPLSAWFGASSNEPTAIQLEALEAIFSGYSDEQLKTAAHWTIAHWEYRNIFPSPAVIKNGLKDSKRQEFGNIILTKGSPNWKLWEAFFQQAQKNEETTLHSLIKFKKSDSYRVPTAKPPKNFKVYQNWLDNN